jgi:transposase
MWTQAHRETYKQSGAGLPSDLTDVQWERLEPLIPAAKPGGRPRKTDMRTAMNAIFYLLRTGCPWRYLPRGRISSAFHGLQHLPPVPARRRVGAHLGRAPHGAARSARPRGQPDRRGPRQPVAESGGKRGAASRSEKDAVGYDAGKKVKGRKLHALVDVEGLPLRVIVHSAAMQDRDGARRWFSTRSASAFHGWSSFGPIPVTTPVRSKTPSPDCRDSGSKSSSVRTTPKASSCCPSLGGRANLLLVRPQPPSGQGLREPRRNARRLHNLGRHPIRHQTPCSRVGF